MKEKKCTKCGEVKLLEEFHRLTKSKDGRQSRCRLCVKEYSKKYYWSDPELMRLKNKEKYEKFKDKYLQDQRNFRAENKELMKERDRRKYEKNKHKYRDREAKYREENKSIIADRKRAYYERNKQVFNEAYYTMLSQSQYKKLCAKCNVLKLANEFYKHQGQSDGLHCNCKECISIIEKTNRQKNYKHYIERRRKYLANLDRDDLNSKARDRYNKKKKDTNWYNAMLSRQAKYVRDRSNADHLFKLKRTLRKIVWASITGKGYAKKINTEKVLGAKIDVVKKYIERQFLPGMSWSNHGEWHIDHKIPLSSAKTEAQLIKLNHYRNLQPLWAKDNLSKGAKIIQPVQTYLPL